MTGKFVFYWPSFVWYIDSHSSHVLKYLSTGPHSVLSEFDQLIMEFQKGDECAVQQTENPHMMA